jgi:hypothetical protein
MRTGSTETGEQCRAVPSWRVELEGKATAENAVTDVKDCV